MTAPTDSSAAPAWPTCQAADGCRGVQVGGSGACLAHLDESKLGGWLATLEPGSELDLRGTPIDPELLDQVLTALRPKDGSPTAGAAWFDRAQFHATAGFDGVQFSGAASFKGAQFSGDASFDRTQFHGNTGFEGTQFSGVARFERAQFRATAGFEGAQFSGDASFDRTQFHWGAYFYRVQFSGSAWFGGAQFSGGAWFGGAQFSGGAWFVGTQVSGGETSFFGARFKQAGTLGPLLAVSRLLLDQATFEQTIAVEVASATVSCIGTRFAETATLHLRYAEIALDRTVFTKPSTIAFAEDTFTRRDSIHGGSMEAFDEGLVPKVTGSQSPQPRLVSLRGLDVATLTLTELDLAACLFQGAHNLDQLRIEGARPFADTPAAWRLRLGGRWVPLWRRWSRRQTLAEEHHWRSEQSSPAEPGRRSWLAQPRWHGPACQTPAWVAEQSGQRVERLSPDRLAVLYRALRKAQEDSKNEPGAADFYYGEMEMRRLTPATPWGERVILTLYWLVSGYGLRGMRALATLGVVVVLLATLFYAIGFAPARPPPSWWDSLLYTSGSTLSISDDALKLTAWGKLLRILLRLLGPLLLGLALLSVRNRVKR
jgi:uncharacterized protein YjbI with pentapeptide repeats